MESIAVRASSCMPFRWESAAGKSGGGGGTAVLSRRRQYQQQQQNESDRSVSVCVCGLPNHKFCMLNLPSQAPPTPRQRQYTWVPMSICSVFSSSTPTVPLSSSELLYGNGEGAGTSSHHGANDEVASGDVGGWDQRGNDRQKVKELELQGNKRPLSRNSTNRKTINFDKVSFDRDREDLRPIAGSVVVNKQSPLRANGIKTNLLRADQLLSQRSNGATGRDEDLVAMGTLWSPSHQLQARGTSTASTITTSSTSSSKSTSAPLNGNGVGIFNSSSGSVAGRRGINVNITNSTRPPLTHSSSVGTMGNIVKSNKDAEPKYSDPLSGATPTFQQRLMELAALEAETVRWERTKKVKKKPVKQEKDS